jgi:hypothetical protein
MEQNNWQESVAALVFVFLFVALWVAGSYYFHPENKKKRLPKAVENTIIVHEPSPVKML